MSQNVHLKICSELPELPPPLPPPPPRSAVVEDAVLEGDLLGTSAVAGQQGGVEDAARDPGVIMRSRLINKRFTI